MGKKAVSAVGEGSAEGMRTFGPGLAGQWLRGQESEMPGRGNFFVWTGTDLGKLKKDLRISKSSCLAVTWGDNLVRDIGWDLEREREK